MERDVASHCSRRCRQGTVPSRTTKSAKAQPASAIAGCRGVPQRQDLQLGKGSGCKSVVRCGCGESVGLVLPPSRGGSCPPLRKRKAATRQCGRALGVWLLLPPAAGVPIDTRLYIGSAGCVCVQRSPQQAGQTLGARMCSRPEQERANSVPRKGGRQEEALAHGESHAGAKPGRWEGASRAAPRALARGQTNVPAVGGRRSPPRPQLISPPPLAGAAEIPHPWRAGTAGRSAAPNPPPLTIREREAMSISSPAWRRHNSLTRTNKT